MNTQNNILYALGIMLVFSMFLTSCSENQEIEVRPSEDFLPQAQGEYDYNDEVEEEARVPLDSLQLALKGFFPGIVFDSVNPLTERKVVYMPDRLGYTHKTEERFSLDGHAYHYLQWEFEDSSKTVNAFYNWLDCFGAYCHAVRINEEKNIEKEAFILWISPTHITYLAGEENLSLTDWQNIFFYQDVPITDWYYILQQNVKGRMKWVVSAKDSEKETEES